MQGFKREMASLRITMRATSTGALSRARTIYLAVGLASRRPMEKFRGLL